MFVVQDLKFIVLKFTLASPLVFKRFSCRYVCTFERVFIPVDQNNGLSRRFVLTGNSR